MGISEYAKVFMGTLDKQMLEGATSGWMEKNAGQVKYCGGNEVKLPKLSLSGLGDYDRTSGFAEGSVTFQYETLSLSQDRGRTFQLDAMDVDETNFALAAGNVLGEFQRTQVIPEVDAYRYSSIAAKAITKSRSSEYTPDKSTILHELLADIARIQDVTGEGAEIVITMPVPVGSLLKEATGMTHSLDVGDFRQGSACFRVKMLDGCPIVQVPSARMKTAYTFLDGTTEGEEDGGFAADEDALDINWILAVRQAPVAVSKTDVSRIFDPMTNQKANAWKIDYRKYHDLWIPDQAWDGVWVSVKPAEEEGGADGGEGNGGEGNGGEGNGGENGHDGE